MRLTVLGWQGPVPGAGGACSGYLLEADSGESMVLDLGSGSLGNLKKYVDPRELKAIVLSHLHYDHMSDMLPLGYLAGMNAVPVYVPEEPKAVRDALAALGWQLCGHQAFQAGPFCVEFGPARHPVAANSVKVTCEGKTFVYTGDTNTCEGLAEFCRGADLLLADGGLCEEDYAENKPHLSPRLCGELAKEAGAKALVVTHLQAHRGADLLLAEARAEYPEAVLAEGGLRIRI